MKFWQIMGSSVWNHNAELHGDPPEWCL